jgi:hypothetical protein
MTDALGACVLRLAQTDHQYQDLVARTLRNLQGPVTALHQVMRALQLVAPASR